MSDDQLQIGLMLDDWVDLSPSFTSFNSLSLECSHGKGSGTWKQGERQSYMTNDMDVGKDKELRPLIQLLYPFSIFP